MRSYKKLIETQSRNNSKLCIGLDTSLDLIPSHFKKDISSIFEFNKQIIDATCDLVCAYKLNFAFYEQYGSKGFDELKKTFDIIPEDLLKIADAKRSDIGNTSRAYAKSLFEYFDADAVTINPYMGFDSVEPFLSFPDKLSFLLCLTSNQGAKDIQYLECNGKPIYRHVIEKAMGWGDEEKLGFVVGATHHSELADLRSIAKKQVFLIPGIGAQGGSIAETMKANAGGPAIINVSRGIIYCSKEKNFAEQVRAKAIEYNALLNQTVV